MNTSKSMILETNNECPYCHSTKSHHWALGQDYWMQTTSQTFDYVKCETCCSLYMKTRPNEKDIGSFYNGEYEPYLVNSSSEQSNSLHRIYSKILVRINKFFRSKKLISANSKFYGSIGSKDTFVDFGCGSGAFLKSLAKKSFRSIGVDFSPIAIKSMHALGLEAYDVEKFWEKTPSGSINYLRMNHVIEHLYSPDVVFSLIHAKLSSHGKLHLAVPNASGPSARMFGKFWYGLECPRHIAIPTPESCKILLERNGFGNVTIVHEAISKDFLRSVGFMFASAGLIKFKTANGLIHNKFLELIFGGFFKAFSLLGYGDRFHVFCEKI